LANEFGRLAQEVGGRVIPTNTIFFIKLEQVPINRKKGITYGSFCCDLKPNKKETHRTRLTAGGDRINYPDDVGTPTVDMTLVKSQDLLQQHYLNKRGKMRDVRRQRFLLEYTNGRIQIHEVETHQHP
jgi:hypothetical protein